jgi:predicted RNA-binding Zn-ribbon protein involved in translation (DUF1610 family)
MSYYGVHSAEINYMICAMCGHEAFAWMAEEFACPTCGSSDYECPESESEIDKDAAAYKITCQASIHDLERLDRKRKRILSDDGMLRR